VKNVVVEIVLGAGAAWATVENVPNRAGLYRLYFVGKDTRRAHKAALFGPKSFRKVITQNGRPYVFPTGAMARQKARMCQTY
jgi:hypothetical protein